MRKTYIVGSIVLAAPLLVGCHNRPVDVDEICRAALQGTDWGNGAIYQKCSNDVSWAAYRASHAAAKPYRDIER